MSKLDAKIPDGPLDQKWTNHKNNIFQYIYKLIYALNRLKSELI